MGGRTRPRLQKQFINQEKDGNHGDILLICAVGSTNGQQDRINVSIWMFPAAFELHLMWRI